MESPNDITVFEALSGCRSRRKRCSVVDEERTHRDEVAETIRVERALLSLDLQVEQSQLDEQMKLRTTHLVSRLYNHGKMVMFDLGKTSQRALLESGEKAMSPCFGEGGGLRGSAGVQVSVVNRPSRRRCPAHEFALLPDVRAEKKSFEFSVTCRALDQPSHSQ